MVGGGEMLNPMVCVVQWASCKKTSLLLHKYCPEEHKAFNTAPYQKNLSVWSHSEKGGRITWLRKSYR